MWLVASATHHFPGRLLLQKNLEDANATAAAKLDETHRDAVENLGESEVREALLAKADHLASIGHKVSDRFFLLPCAHPVAIYPTDRTLTSPPVATYLPARHQSGRSHFCV